MADLTGKILRQIRDEIRELRKDVTRLDAGQSATNERLDRLDRRQIETETRLATELIAVATAVREVRDVLIEDRQLRSTVSDHERRLSRLESSR